ncbi:unnamed protein product, partial [marine sediment metagenome]
MKRRCENCEYWSKLPLTEGKPPYIGSCSNEKSFYIGLETVKDYSCEYFYYHKWKHEPAKEGKYMQAFKSIEKLKEKVKKLESWFHDINIDYISKTEVA